MGFQVIVCLRSKGIIEWLPGKPCLYFGALLQRIIARREWIRFAARIGIQALGFAVFQHSLEGAQGVERTWETGIGI